MNLNYASTVLLVALCWMSASNFAQASNSTTAMPNATATAMSHSSTMMAHTTSAPMSNSSTMMAHTTSAPMSHSSTMMAHTTSAPMSNSSTMMAHTTSAPMSHSSTMMAHTTSAPMSNSSTMMAHTTSAPMSNSSTMMAHATSAPMSNSSTMMAHATSAPMSNSSTMMAHATSAPMSNSSTMMPHATSAPMSNSSTMMPHATSAPMSNSSTMMAHATSAPMSNSSAHASTMMANDTTSMTATTAALPFESNTTVVPLATNLTRDGCGVVKFCAAEPSDCDPSSDSCYYCGFKQDNGRNFEMEMAGETDGYIGLTVESSSGAKRTYICSRRTNGDIVFNCANPNGDSFTIQTGTDCPVQNVKGKSRGRRLQCGFDATLPDPTSRATETYSASIQTGTYNESGNGTFGPPNTLLRTGLVDLANPASNGNNTIGGNNGTTNGTTNGTSNAAASTMIGNITLQQSISRAFLIILGVMCLAWV